MILRVVSIPFFLWGVLQAQSVTVNGCVSVTRGTTVNVAATDSSNAVVWLMPLEGPADRATDAARPRFKILQHHKRFDPHVLAVPMGSVVDFPNLDPFFHNVFSMFDGKRFDLGLYESGASHSATFERPGVCYIFCNIHPEMSAVVVVVDTPHYAVSKRTGDFSIAGVPAGRYLIFVWHERGKPGRPTDFPSEVTISQENPALPTIHLIDTGQFLPPHKNKYGRDYDTPKSPVYK